MTDTPMTAQIAVARLRQYGERTSTWSTATYNNGAEKALHQIALTLAAELHQLRDDIAGACLARWEEEQDNARLRLAWQSARQRAQAHGEGVLRAVNDREAWQQWFGQEQKCSAVLRAELAKYVNVEPTVDEEMAYLHRCLDAVLALCDDAEQQATRWENPLAVPEWVEQVRKAAEGSTS